jgi:hypothetical protein
MLLALDRSGAFLANLRVLTFVSAVVLTLLVIFEKLSRLGLIPMSALLLGYAVLAARHATVIFSEKLSRAILLLNERGLVRLSGGWRTFPQTGTDVPPEGHLYASDLDVVGHASLFQRLDETGTAAGASTLLDWLVAPRASTSELVARQNAVRSLAPRLDFRQLLVAETRMAGEAKADPSRFLDWAETPPELQRYTWAYRLAHLLPPFTVGAGILAIATPLSPLLFWIGLGCQLAINVIVRRACNATWTALRLGDVGFLRFEEAFRAIDKESFDDPTLVALQKAFADGPKVSIRLRAFSRLLGLAEIKGSGQLHPIINALFMWDLHVFYRLNRWKKAHGHGVRKWFEALASFEALSCLAAWAFERPADVFPSFRDGPAYFVAQGLGHPLLEQPVRNDLDLKGPGSGLIITGSNMSGKTTFLRAIGLNAVMAQAGLPVCATQLELSRSHVVTSMRIFDSLERGVSYFYAEVERVKRLVDEANAHPNACLFLLDELFMGTNTRERQVASRHLLTLLLDKGCIGAVTTHDITLCSVAEDRAPFVRNVHFRDHLEDDRMVFDYRLREGVVQTSNALEILRRAGVPMPAAE